MAKYTIRPYKAWEPDDPYPYGTCGTGKLKQLDIHDDADKVKFLSAYARRQPSRSPALVRLGNKINALLQREGMAALRAERKKWGIKNLQLTIVSDDDGFHLVYARPLGKRSRARSR